MVATGAHAVATGRSLAAAKRQPGHAVDYVLFLYLDEITAGLTGASLLVTFGYPISRMFAFLGCHVQMFQRFVVQLCSGQDPALLNLLEPDIFPYTRVNGSVFPGPDSAMKPATPKFGDLNYDVAMLDFILANT
jgi:hypothetical protein